MLAIDIVIFLLVLSLLVAVHEFGHFIAAKACGIYVDRFSIGMPPRIIGFKWGETDYCIGALPIGGYVKMAGQEDSPLSEEEREKDYGHVPPERWFHNKPVWQRAIVLVAGPFMNIVLAVLLYGALAAIGSEVPEFELNAKIGQVEEGSPAESAPLYLADSGRTTGEPDAVGWKTGDEILTLDGEPVENIARLAVLAILDGDEQVRNVVLQRPNPDGTYTRYLSPITPKLLSEDEDYPRFGVGPFESAQVRETFEGQPAAAAGLQPDDVIVRVDGQPVDRAGLIELVSKAKPGQSFNLDVERGGEAVQIALSPVPVGKIEGMVALPESEADDARVVVAGVEQHLSDLASIKPGDVITAVNGQSVSAKQFKAIEQQSAGTDLTVTIERPARLFGLKQAAETLTVALPVEQISWMGVALGPKMVFHRVPPSQILSEAFKRSYEAIALTLGTLKALVMANVSPKDLGGPLMIFDITTKAAEAGWAWLLKITAFISINLAIFNLLPLPVLDGGQLLVNGIEAIRRKPLSPVFLERFQQVGLVMIIALMLFVTWNDIGRLIGD